jgi:aminopeptidase 2
MHSLEGGSNIILEGIDIPKIMENWISKVGFITVALLKTQIAYICLIKMGYPVLTVTESQAGIRVRQDRFLESGPAEPKENETIWYIPSSPASSSSYSYSYSTGPFL